MGEWFTSFDDAWAHFLAREEPLESFYDALPEDPDATLELWLVVPPPEVKLAALKVQGALEEVPGLRILPHHFLHISVGGTHRPMVDQLLELPPFELRLPRLNCFHDAVVSEAESEAFAALDAPPHFLPHLSLAYLELPVSPAPVREALVPLRTTSLGAFVVDELVRVDVPIARHVLFEPWTVVERAPLRR